MEEEKNCVAQVVRFHACMQVVCLKFETSAEVSDLNISVGNSFFLENYVTSEGDVSHNALYHQQLSIVRYKCVVYANNYFPSTQNSIQRL